MKRLKESKIGVFLFLGRRIVSAFELSARSTAAYFKGAFTSRETTTLTYPLTRENENYLLNLISQISGQTKLVIESYFKEFKANTELQELVIQKIANSHYRNKKDLRCDFGSRIGWYALVRSGKYAVCVENGIEMGLTALAICSALEKNKQEGYPGTYYGLDINPDAGFLLKSNRFSTFSEIIIGDSIESLKSLNVEKIDFYFSDGIRTYDYEKEEFQALTDKLSKICVIVTNKANFSQALYDIAEKMEKRFAYFQEQPLGHWYKGSGIGIMY